MNKISISKLKLSGAQLLTRLIDYIMPSLTCKPAEIHCWSHSRNTTCLLRSSPAKLKPIEVNKVSVIIITLSNVRWRYVPSAENPAHCDILAMSVDDLEAFSLGGPSWLQEKSR